MVRFIFLCMAVVALSFATLAAQSLMDNMGDAQTSVMARNAEPAIPTTDLAATNDPAETETAQIAETLNDINTAAGAADEIGFGDAFTNIAPKALEDNISQINESNPETEPASF